MSRRDRAIPHGDIPAPVEVEEITPVLGEYTDNVYSALDEAIPAAVTQTLTAARTFDQMIRGDKVHVNPLDNYWANQLKAGNVYVAKEDAE